MRVKKRVTRDKNTNEEENMNVLAIMGSPRKNSDSLKVTRQVEERMHELGEELCPLKDGSGGS